MDLPEQQLSSNTPKDSCKKWAAYLPELSKDQIQTSLNSMEKFPLTSMGFGSTPCRGTLFKINIREKKIIRTVKPFILSPGYILKQEGGNVLFSLY